MTSFSDIPPLPPEVKPPLPAPPKEEGVVGRNRGKLGVVIGAIGGALASGADIPQALVAGLKALLGSLF